MNSTSLLRCTLALIVFGNALQAQRPAPIVPDAIVDLSDTSALSIVQGEWRYHAAELPQVEYRAAGPDRKASGPANKTFDIEPKAGSMAFDDSAWEVISAESLEDRRTKGRLSFGWYRLHLRLPMKFGSLDTAGATVVFEIVVDDYAEVWVDGKLPLALGSEGGALIAGFNAPNRVVLARDALPGSEHTIAVFAANGPLSQPPSNFVWVRSATLDVYAPGRFAAGEPVALKILERKPGLDALIDDKLQPERLATGFQFAEGPQWAADGSLLFSDPNANVIQRWHPEQGVSIFRTKSGYKGLDIARLHQPGSNGLGLDPEGRLLICEHGNRRVTRLEPNGVLNVLAERFEGKRLNSPNDLVVRSDGALFFSDPPFGLPSFHADPSRELDFTGVFCLKDGVLSAVVRDLNGPNGLDFSPDERFLYVGNWDTQRKVVMRYPVEPSGALGLGSVFADLAGPYGEEAIDGLEVDALGNVYVCGPGGVWVFTPEGAHLGTLVLPELPANLAWGDADSGTLYFTARSGLYRLRTKTHGPRTIASGKNS